jgi:hypothetical protein
MVDIVEKNRKRLSEIRNKARMKYYMSKIREGYMHTKESYKEDRVITSNAKIENNYK